MMVSVTPRLAIWARSFPVWFWFLAGSVGVCAFTVGLLVAVGPHSSQPGASPQVTPPASSLRPEPHSYGPAPYHPPPTPHPVQEAPTAPASTAPATQKPPTQAPTPSPTASSTPPRLPSGLASALGGLFGGGRTEEGRPARPSRGVDTGAGFLVPGQH